MRRLLIAILAAALLVVSAAACSEGFWDPGGVEFLLDGPNEFMRPQEQQTIPFTAAGPPVDDAVVCGSGTMTFNHLESMDGETITSEDWAAMFDTAVEDGGIAEMYSFQDFECDDGLGGFSMKVHAKYDFSSFEFDESEQDIDGHWGFEEGTGSYSVLSGGGDITIDWDNDNVKYDGEAFDR
jgi:hypothetical protein